MPKTHCPRDQQIAYPVEGAGSCRKAPSCSPSNSNFFGKPSPEVARSFHLVDLAYFFCRVRAFVAWAKAHQVGLAQQGEARQPSLSARHIRALGQAPSCDPSFVELMTVSPLQHMFLEGQREVCVLFP